MYSVVTLYLVWVFIYVYYENIFIFGMVDLLVNKAGACNMPLLTFTICQWHTA